MLKKIFFLVLLLSITVSAFAKETNEKDTFLAAKDAYDRGSFSISSDLLERFIGQFPNSKALSEAQLYLGQSLFQEDKFMEARDVLTKLEKDYVLYGIEDRLLFWLGQTYLKVKDFDQAAEYFNKLIKIHPDSGLLYSAKMQLGWIFLQEGSLEEAQDMFDTLTESSDVVIQEEALFRKGELQFQAKDYKGASESFKTFAAVFVSSEQLPNAYFYMAESSFYLNDFNQAREYYLETLERSDNDLIKAESLQGIGWSYLNKDMLAEAEEAFSKVEKFITEEFNQEGLMLGKATLYYRLNRLEESYVYYGKLLRMYPESDTAVQALFGQAECLNGLSRFDEAIQIYEEAIARSAARDNGKVRQGLTAQAHYNLGLAYFEKADFDAAIVELENAIDASEDEQMRLSALYHIGESNQNIKEFGRAIEIYKKILQDYPDNSYNDYVLYQLGLVQFKSGQINAAIESFKEFNKKFVHSEFLDDINYYLCYAYFNNNELEMAIHRLSRFVEVFSDSIYKDEATYLLAVAFYNTGVLSEALYHYEKILKEFRHNKELTEKVEHEAANVLYQMGDVKSAVKRYSQFVSAHPKSELTPGVIFWLGQYYQEDSQYELARRNFEMLVRMYPKHDLAQEARYQIGLTFLAEDRYDDALKMLERLSDMSNQQELKARTMLAIGDLLLQEGKKEEALKRYNKLTQLAYSNNIDLQTPLKSQITEDENNKASKSILELVKLAHIRLGDIYKEEKKFSAAISSYKEALKLNFEESNAEIQFNIAESLEQSNDLDRALDRYQSISFKHEQDKVWIVKGLLRAGRIYEDRRDWPSAIKTYEKILGYNVPEAKYAQEKLAIIKSNTDN